MNMSLEKGSVLYVRILFHLFPGCASEKACVSAEGSMWYLGFQILLCTSLSRSERKY